MVAMIYRIYIPYAGFGMFGIKLHPDYQGVEFDDPRYLKIISEAAKRDLIVVTHAGVDVAFRDHVHCTPDMILRVLEILGSEIENKLVLAHLGGYELPDESLEKLVGKPVYMDTAAVLKLYPEKCREIIARQANFLQKRTRITQTGSDLVENRNRRIVVLLLA